VVTRKIFKKVTRTLLVVPSEAKILRERLLREFVKKVAGPVVNNFSYFFALCWKPTDLLSG
jgi:hypothetical protein